jgi:hypothetical protein
MKTISNVDVFKKAEIPDNLHYKSNVRIGDIVIIAKLGYTIWKEPSTDINWKITSKKIRLD